MGAVLLQMFQSANRWRHAPTHKNQPREKLRSAIGVALHGQQRDADERDQR